MSIIKLKSSDEKILNIEKDVASISITIKNLLEFTNEDDEEEIPLPNVSYCILEKVIEWCVYHKEYPCVKYAREKLCEEWDRKYLKNNNDILADISLAADYLDIRSLFDLCCIGIMDKILQMDPTEFKEKFLKGDESI